LSAIIRIDASAGAVDFSFSSSRVKFSEIVKLDVSFGGLDCFTLEVFFFLDFYL